MSSGYNSAIEENVKYKGRHSSQAYKEERERITKHKVL